MASRVSRNIRSARGNANLTRKQLAKRIGVTVQALSYLELGYGDPRLSTLRKIARATKRPLAELVA